MGGVTGRVVHRDLVARLVDGDGCAPAPVRRSAFDNDGVNGALGGALGDLIEKVAQNAASVTDGDLARVRESGLSDDQIFEIVVCAAVGQASRQYESAMGTLAEAAGKERRS